MPVTTSSNAAPQPATTDPQYAVLLLQDSPLQGSDELAFGLARLERIWPGTSPDAPQWLKYRAQNTPSPSTLCSKIRVPYLLVLTEPALLGDPSLPAHLAAALQSDGSICAVAQDARDAFGPWTPDYSTQVDFKRYVDRRAALLPMASSAKALAAQAPKAYMLRLDRLDATALMQAGEWATLPLSLGSATVVAPRAYVHSYADYQQGSRAEMLAMLPPAVQRLLDVGGGEGGFARDFIRQRAGQAVVLEPSPQAAQVARSRGMQVMECGIETLDIGQFEHFDAVSFLDVLEHLKDPLQALKSARNLLRPGGVLLLSIPNIGHWPVIRDLAMGRFDYQPVGILCVTHLRFFTERSIRELLAQAGFEVIEIRRHCPPMTTEFEEALHAMQTAGMACDRDSLATLSLYILAHAN